MSFVQGDKTNNWRNEILFRRFCDLHDKLKDKWVNKIDSQLKLSFRRLFVSTHFSKPDKTTNYRGKILTLIWRGYFFYFRFARFVVFNKAPKRTNAIFR